MHVFMNFRELGIGIVPYCPLGRGFLSVGAKLLDNASEGDVRKVGSHLVTLHGRISLFDSYKFNPADSAAKVPG